ASISSVRANAWRPARRSSRRNRWAVASSVAPGKSWAGVARPSRRWQPFPVSLVNGAAEAIISTTTTISPAPDDKPASVLGHGGHVLPAVTVDTYNEELRDGEGFVGDRASGRAFRAILDDWRDKLRAQGEDPFG